MSSKCSLLELPRELRDYIYSLSLSTFSLSTIEYVTIPESRSFSRLLHLFECFPTVQYLSAVADLSQVIDCVPINLLLTNRQIYHECLNTMQRRTWLHLGFRHGRSAHPLIRLWPFTFAPLHLYYPQLTATATARFRKVQVLIETGTRQKASAMSKNFHEIVQVFPELEILRLHVETAIFWLATRSEQRLPPRPVSRAMHFLSPCPEPAIHLDVKVEQVWTNIYHHVREDDELEEVVEKVRFRTSSSSNEDAWLGLKYDPLDTGPGLEAALLKYPALIHDDGFTQTSAP